jgi:hypothetical protein
MKMASAKVMVKKVRKIALFAAFASALAAGALDIAMETSILTYQR